MKVLHSITLAFCCALLGCGSSAESETNDSSIANHESADADGLESLGSVGSSRSRSEDTEIEADEFVETPSADCSRSRFAQQLQQGCIANVSFSRTMSARLLQEFRKTADAAANQCPEVNLKADAQLLSSAVVSDMFAGDSAAACLFVANKLINGDPIYDADGKKPSLFTSNSSREGIGAIDTSSFKNYANFESTLGVTEFYIDPASVEAGQKRSFDIVEVLRRQDGKISFKRKSGLVNCNDGQSYNSNAGYWERGDPLVVKAVCETRFM